MTVLVTKPAVNIREELADLKDQTTYDTVKSAGALMDAELANEAAVKGIDQALTTTSSVEFTQVTGALVGNASTATTLETARDITLSGDVTGSASFDGSGNIDITATVADDSHNHTIANVDGLQTALDAKQPLDADLTKIAGLTSTNDGDIIVGSASGWVAESGATARASLGLTIGTDVQGVLAEGAFVDGDKTKLDGIETGADVTDATNVEAAGALMDSELTSITAVKALDQGVATTDSPTFSNATITNLYKGTTDTLSAATNPGRSVLSCSLSGTATLFAATGTVSAGAAGLILVTTDTTPVISIGAAATPASGMADTLSTAGTYIVSWYSNGSTIYAAVTQALA